jgi:hypothetical protein
MRKLFAVVLAFMLSGSALAETYVCGQVIFKRVSNGILFGSGDNEFGVLPIFSEDARKIVFLFPIRPDIDTVSIFVIKKVDGPAYHMDTIGYKKDRSLEIGSGQEVESRCVVID